MFPQVYHINKSSGTSADTLLTVGFMYLLQALLRHLGKPSANLLLEDMGDAYQLTVPTGITESDIERLTPFTVVDALVSGKQREKKEKQGKTLRGFDYDAEMEKARTYREKLSALPAECRRQDAPLYKYPELEAIREQKPRTELPMYQAIQLMKVADSFNELALRWDALTAEQVRVVVSVLLVLFADRGNDVAAAQTQYQRLAKEVNLTGKVRVSALQIVNPTTGKGANREKASELSIGNQESFWLLELLKFVGFMHCTAPFVVQGSKDRKIYVLNPQRIQPHVLDTLMRTFREVCWSSTAVKLDILATLRFTQVFARHREEQFQLETEERDEFDDPLVISVAQGFEVTHYKDMGSAYATMNISSLNFPDWLPPITDKHSAGAVLELLREHIGLIQQLRTSKGEEGSEEFELLRFYRDFLSGRNLRPFWKFTTAYSGYLISQREREKNPRRYIRQFSMKGLEQLIMRDTDLLEITSNEGFLHIASAIREATVEPQRRKHQSQGPQPYEVRYGLGQDLMRKARYPKEFMVALCDFVYKYQAESAQEEEKAARDITRKTGKARALTSQERKAYGLRFTKITDNDLQEVTRLVEKSGSELICLMLVAWGYARYGGTGPSEENASTAEGEAPSVEDTTITATTH